MLKLGPPIVNGNTFYSRVILTCFTREKIKIYDASKTLAQLLGISEYNNAPCVYAVLFCSLHFFST